MYIQTYIHNNMYVNHIKLVAYNNGKYNSANRFI